MLNMQLQSLNVSFFVQILITSVQSLRTTFRQYLTIPFYFTQRYQITAAYLTRWNDETVNVKMVTISSPHFTVLAEVFCVELVLYWSVWFITGCVSVDTVQEDRRGDYLDIVLSIGGLPQERAARRSTHRGHAALERCSTKIQQTSTPWDRFLWQAAFCPQWCVWLQRSFLSVALNEKLWS